MTEPGTLLRSLFEIAVAAALPSGKFDGKLPNPPNGRTIVLGAGKASGLMAVEFARVWPAACEGLVVAPYGSKVAAGSIEVVEAAHPVPDEAGMSAALRILALAQSAGPDDLVVALISGGASALLCLPARGLSLPDKRRITDALLKSGAPISEINVVRQHLSAIKGGRLAVQAAPARTVTYLISDVPGDDPAIIGSGPTIGNRKTPADALQILHKYEIAVADEQRTIIIENGMPEDLPAAEVHMLASPIMALEAAAEAARGLGLEPVILGDAIEGEARDVAGMMAAIAKSARRNGHPASAPCVLLSGGETSVTVRGKGRGGRNAEFLLALQMALRDVPGIAALACDTDGIDGSEDNAGAWFGPDLLGRDGRNELAAFLDRNDAYSYYSQANHLVMTGPTGTNVNDFRAILVMPE